jgi:hypothetical protein
MLKAGQVLYDNDRAAKLAAIPAGESPANRRRSSHCCSHIQRRGGRPIRRKPGSKSPRGLGRPSPIRAGGQATWQAVAEANQ